MRYVIYFLLAANLVFYGWQTLQAQNADGVERALPGLPVTAKPLMTLQEMEQMQQQEQAPVAEPETGPEAETGPQPGPQPNSDQGLAEGLDQFAMVESLTEMQPPGGGGAVTCRTLGPILAVAQVRALGGMLDDLGLEPRHRTSEIQDATGYWVMLPAMEYSTAQEIKRRLDKRGDKEYYIGKGNFISLGTFKELSRAQVRLEQAGKLDLQAVIEPRYVTQTAHWLDIDRRSSDAVDLGAVMQDYPGIQVQEQACY